MKILLALAVIFAITLALTIVALAIPEDPGFVRALAGN
jgi:hypothetical protein